MTTQEKIESIRQACVKVLPEIGGCKNRCSNGNQYLGESPEDGMPEWGACSECVFNGKYHPTPPREVRLADVLLAIEEKYGVESRVMVNAYGLFFLVSDGETETPGLLCQETAWNLRTDDLTQQSEETINFLFDLLTSPDNQ